MKGGRVFGVLLRNEWFKARKRIVLWMALGFYALVTFMDKAYSFFERSEGFRLPDIWASVFRDDSATLVMFAAITLVLLTATEFSWRTARQNVIAGLSKSQWFWGKTLLLPIVGLAFVAAHVLIPGVLALIRTDMGAAESSLVPLSVFQATGGLVLAFLSVGAPWPSSCPWRSARPARRLPYGSFGLARSSSGCSPRSCSVSCLTIPSGSSTSRGGTSSRSSSFGITTPQRSSGWWPPRRRPAARLPRPSISARM